MDNLFPPDSLGKGDFVLLVIVLLACAACLVHAAFKGGKP